MKKLTTDRIYSYVLPVATAWLLGECMQSRGKQDLWMQQRPEALQVLREQAVVQSVESSNRIEGVSIAADRLRPVVLGKAQPEIALKKNWRAIARHWIGFFPGKGGWLLS